jgi:hypothetical protein
MRIVKNNFTYIFHPWFDRHGRQCPGQFTKEDLLCLRLVFEPDDDGCQADRDNIDVRGKFRTDTAPRACSPCIQLYFISLGPYLDDAGVIGASGTIDGIYYPNLYVRLNDFRYFSTGYGRVPKLWTKTVRVTKIPVDMRGNLGIWRTPEEVGNNSIALYLHNNMEFTGTANLHLSWYVRPNEPRLYGDRYLSLEFAYAGS